MGLGDKLRDARIDKGYTLNTMQQMSKIQKKYLQAIEEEKFDEMPGTFYVRAFIKQYADIVGLNGDELLEEYEDELNLDQVKEDALEASGATKLPKRSELTKSDEKTTFDVVMAYLPMILLIGVIIAIIISLIYAINAMNSEPEEPDNVGSMTSVVSLVELDSSEDTSISVEDESVDQPEESIELSENQQQVGDQVITLVSGEGESPVYSIEGSMADYTFEIEAGSVVWAGVFEDGVIVIDQVINEGETVDYQPASTVQSLSLHRGYPEGAIFKVNGTEVDLPEGMFIESIEFVVGAPSASGMPGDSDATVAPDEVNEPTNETEVSQEEAEAADGYQGPAVYDPNNN